MKDITIHRNSNQSVSVNIPHTIVRHSPDGFEFGYNGSGPSDLALNILYYFTNDLDFCNRHYVEFRQMYIASLDRNVKDHRIIKEVIIDFINGRRLLDDQI